MSLPLQPCVHPAHAVVSFSLVQLCLANPHGQQRSSPPLTYNIGPPPAAPAVAAGGAGRPAHDVQLQRGHEPERAVCAHAAGTCQVHPPASNTASACTAALPCMVAQLQKWWSQDRLHALLLALPLLPCCAAGGGSGCVSADHGAARGRRRARSHAGPHLPRGPVPHQCAAARAVNMDAQRVILARRGQQHTNGIVLGRCVRVHQHCKKNTESIRNWAPERFTTAAAWLPMLLVGLATGVADELAAELEPQRTCSILVL